MTKNKCKTQTAFNITHEQASAAILEATRTGRLRQLQWSSNGGEKTCLLGSMHVQIRSVYDCNPNLMPFWLADLTVDLFDRLASGEIWSIAERYGQLIKHWHTLQEADWNSILTTFLINTIDTTIRVVQPHAERMAYWPIVSIACQQAKDALANNDKSATIYNTLHIATDAIHRASNMTRDCGNMKDASRAAIRASEIALYAINNHNSGTVSRVTGNATEAAFQASDGDAAYRAAINLKLFTFLLDQIEEKIEKKIEQPKESTNSPTDSPTIFELGLVSEENQLMQPITKTQRSSSRKQLGDRPTIQPATTFTTFYTDLV